MQDPAPHEQANVVHWMSNDEALSRYRPGWFT